MKQRVIYQWSHDGSVEECDAERFLVTHSETCYHCDNAITSKDYAWNLNSSDGSLYMLCDRCYQRSTIELATSND
ncbi:hypothetical protein [Adlercreutzia sp. ZJ304]|uniref:hypothetical protein n=1 Tax=Adlercreutzia sp. ZJ304 TaxID=2709791 RepID=UPI0013EA7844|nr:hypothetical protein [Adlercreutzia sp. ZJ304]